MPQIAARVQIRQDRRLLGRAFCHPGGTAIRRYPTAYSAVTDPAASTRASSSSQRQILTLLERWPLTCALASETLVAEATNFCVVAGEGALIDPDRFARHLHERAAAGGIGGAWLDDMLRYESAAFALRTGSPSVPSAPDAGIALGSRVRLVRLHHDPIVIIDALRAGRRPSQGLAPGEHYVLLIAHEEGIETHIIELGMGRLLLALGTSPPAVTPDPALRVLVEAGLVGD
jgi:hypothetical protein